jgi:hypothetical protein
MPIGASVSGTVTRVAVGGTAATGTLSRVGNSTNGATGTLEIDRTLFLAFYSRVRLTRPDVYLDDELMANLVDSVEIDYSLDDPIEYATFTLADPRVAFFDATSVSNGERGVVIDFWAGPPGGVEKWPAFLGNTESSQNAMPYRPRGVFRSVSLAAKWADRKACLQLPALSELTRGAIIQAAAESAGVYISNAVAMGGGIVRRPVDINETPFDLIKKLGEVEGWYARTTADGAGLEIISEDQMLGGEPIFAFDESNTFDVPETCPDRPVTHWVLSATEVVTVPAGGNPYQTTVTEAPTFTDAGAPLSNTITKVTTFHGVEVERIVEDWALIVPGGITVRPEAYLLLRRVTTNTRWGDFLYLGANGSSIQRPSTLLLTRVMLTEALRGTPAATASGYTWTDGGKYAEAYPVFQQESYIDEAYSWAVGSCYPGSGRITISGWYAPLEAGGNAYPDGTERQSAIYQFMEISEDIIGWSTATIYPYGPLLSVERKEWFDNAAGDEIYGIHTRTTQSSPLVGNVLTPSTGSESVPAFVQRVIKAEVDATDASGYARRTESPTALDYAENVDELEAIGRRRIRRDLSDTLAIPHNCIPYLRVGDHVAVTNRARNLVLKDAYVYSIKRTANVLNGGMRQVTTVKIPPGWI